MTSSYYKDYYPASLALISQFQKAVADLTPIYQRKSTIFECIAFLFKDILCDGVPALSGGDRTLDSL
ncbi:MAG: hypothetical protein V7K25_22480 [Nostoc sp.]|uniref:hypothetical protein n=1 Tax=Nostoc sp. TaxID=1180 RepID=UPI002FF605C7